MKKLKKRLLATVLASSCIFSAVATNSNAIYCVGPIPEGYTEFDDHDYFSHNRSPYGESKFYHKGNRGFIEEEILYAHFTFSVSDSLTKEEIAGYFKDSDYFDDYEITIGNPSIGYPNSIRVGFHSDKVSENNAREFYKKIQKTGIKEPEEEKARSFKFYSTSSSIHWIYFWGDASEDITDYFYSSTNGKDVSAMLQQYVEENNIDFSVVTESCNPPKKSASKECDMRCHLIPNKEITIEEHFEVASKIKSDLGIYVPMFCPGSDTDDMRGYSIDVLNAVDGDANEDGNVNMADATAVVQAIGNPDKYALSPQGEFNADVDGNGLTGMDAIEIQMKVASAGMPE